MRSVNFHNAMRVDDENWARTLVAEEELLKGYTYPRTVVRLAYRQERQLMLIYDEIKTTVIGRKNDE